ncbi:MAG TPA: excinuclease ABC subunit UvrB [Planctomycetota bacterium]|nr:excinuclease ABC subunit UvrB [Planctomycetota bacterium]
MSDFQLVTDLQPKGDQPQAIEKLAGLLQEGRRFSTLMGVTGSGKTFTMAHVIARLSKPTLVISHNKTLAAQLYSEFKALFPGNAVHYFVSYYDYYQPEAYIPQKDIYIEKDAMINQDLDRLRLAATNALLSRKDVILVASVSCIYNIGSPEDYLSISRRLGKGHQMRREELIKRLVDMQYERNDTAFERGKFRVRGEAIEIYPTAEETSIRIRFEDDRISAVTVCNPLTGDAIASLDETRLYPAKYFVTPQERIDASLGRIEGELAERLAELRGKGKLVEAQRLEARTRYDMEMLREVGYCRGIENYSLHLSGREPGARPYCLIDYFPKDFLCIVDESHATVPQIRGMFNGDQARKQTLVDYGWRLPTCLDNRPLKFDEWLSLMGQVCFASATPGPYELQISEGRVVEQIIRPTGLVDPRIEVRPTKGQVGVLEEKIRGRAAAGERVLITTLTKRLAEDLSEYLQERKIRCRYLHSEVETFDRVKILRELREGRFDALIGVNLLREGLDLPEVSLVAILDADKEGFLRSETSLIQTVGRTARNVNGEVLLFADTITDSMRRAIEETDRRRRRQQEYNALHGITPESVRKEIRRGIEDILQAEDTAARAAGLEPGEYATTETISELEKQMYEAAAALDFEKAAKLRDIIKSVAGGRGLAKNNPIKFNFVGSSGRKKSTRKP